MGFIIRFGLCWAVLSYACLSPADKKLPSIAGCSQWLANKASIKANAKSQQLFVETSLGHQIFTQIDLPKGKAKGWYFLVHGLLDSHHVFDGLAKSLTAAGFAVARIDLFGFGESLKHYVTSNPQTPNIITNEDQVSDLKDILTFLANQHGALKPTLVGHSMGAGLLIDLLTNDDVSSNVAPRAFLLAPYVYRLEYYELGKRNPWLKSWLELLPELAKAGPEAYLDAVMNDPNMRKHFKEFMKKLRPMRPRITDHPNFTDDAWLDLQIEYGIAAVKGLRDLNSLDLVGKINQNLQLNLIVGTNDQLVELDLQRQLADKMNQRGNATSSEIPFGHMLLDEAPEVIFGELLP